MENEIELKDVGLELECRLLELMGCFFGCPLIKLLIKVAVSIFHLRRISLGRILTRDILVLLWPLLWLRTLTQEVEATLSSLLLHSFSTPQRLMKLQIQGNWIIPGERSVI